MVSHRWFETDARPARGVQGRPPRTSLLKKMASKNLKSVFPERKIKRVLHQSGTSVAMEKERRPGEPSLPAGLAGLMRRGQAISHHPDPPTCLL